MNNNAAQDRGPGILALTLRTAALFILLYQLRLLASDLADTWVFIAAMGGALFSAFFLYQKKFNGRAAGPVQALIILAMVPWTIRLIIAFPRWFIPGVSDAAIVLDSLLLNFDRNNFSALLPFYWIAVTSYFSIRSRVFLRADIIAADTFFLVLFSIAPSAAMEAYRWPVLMIGLFALVLFLQVLSLVFSIPRELKLRRKEGIIAGIFLFLLIVLGSAFFVRPFQERAVERGGGLLEPKLFRFDFSQILRLESEIRVSDDLIMIVKKDPMDSHILLRRYTLSGYGPKQGFFRLEDIDEAAHPQRLPNRRTSLPFNEILNYREMDQEYYLVNFDASAFIGMNTPVEVVPFETWDVSSFNSAYAVKSYTSEARPVDLIRSVRGGSGPGNLKMSEEEYALYTEYGNDEAIASFARDIIRESAPVLRRDGPSSYWEQIEMIYRRLKNGEYRYSLKPGIAPDGDQLKYFLFTTKKGYCSYYAFAFTLMLRSLGIPSRVAAGFFVDPMEEAFNYHPVRADMAHAWVEVWFPGYGWIEYDPTTESLAEGEEFRFSQGTPQELFERLMKEILENRSRLREKEGGDTEGRRSRAADIGRSTLKFLTKSGPILAATLLIILFLAMRSGYYWLSCLNKNPRKKALYLWAHIKRRLALAGFGPSLSGGREAEAEWAKANSGANSDASSDASSGSFSGLYALYLDSAAARFAPLFTPDDNRNMALRYRVFCAEYIKCIPLGRRLLAWLLPPLALLLKYPKPSRDLKTPATLLIFFFLFALHGAQAQLGSRSGDQILDEAMAAQKAENWERAVELFTEGARYYPDDFRFPWSLGNLYYNRSLYRLAWDEYRKAEKISTLETSPFGLVQSSWDPELIIRLANTAGYLNKNEASAGYLEQFLFFDPDNQIAIGSLAWMYFKLHRLSEGEELLLDAMQRLGSDADFSMTLATIYSGMFRYRDAKGWYLQTIETAERTGNRLAAALAYYNLSILESRFYQYSLAYDCANASLEAMNRASGRLARGELYLRRMELPRALGEYQEAYGTDSSPLSKLNLSEVYYTGGRLEEALLYAKDCLKGRDESWMLNYGIDPDRYKRDVHEVIKNCYEGLMNAEAFSCPGNFKEKVRSMFRKISCRFRFEVHTLLFRKYSLLAADAYRAFTANDASSPQGNIDIEALIQYFEAFDAYPSRGLAYIRQARAFEEPLIPGSAPSYNYEEGRLRKNRKLLTDILSDFNPVWERDMIADTYTKLALSGKKADRQDAAERLFALNRGALLRNGIMLPVNLQMARPDGSDDSMERLLKKVLKPAGLEPMRRDSLRYTLNISRAGDGSLLCELYDGSRGINIVSSSLPAPLSKDQRAAFARALRDLVFNGF